MLMRSNIIITVSAYTNGGLYMQVEIYADVVFLINFIMDYFIFWIAGKLSRMNASKLRLVLGSAAGSGLYCLIVFVPFLNRFYGILSAIIILIISIMITYNPKKIKQFLSLIIFSNIAAFSIGGISIALFYYTNIGETIGNFISISIENFSFKILIAATAISYIILKFVFKWISKVLIKKQSFYHINITLNNENVNINALVDTGNTLLDPISKSPVIIVEFDKLKKFLPEAMQLIFSDNNENNLSLIFEIVEGSEIANRMRMIPFRSLGTEEGMLIGFKPDRVEIVNAEKENIFLEDVIIGIYNKTLSKNGDYEALLNPAVLSGV